MMHCKLCMLFFPFITCLYLCVCVCVSSLRLRNITTSRRDPVFYPTHFSSSVSCSWCSAGSLDEHWGRNQWGNNLLKCQTGNHPLYFLLTSRIFCWYCLGGTQLHSLKEMRFDLAENWSRGQPHYLGLVGHLRVLCGGKKSFFCFLFFFLSFFFLALTSLNQM